MLQSDLATKQGEIVALRGTVVDVRFENRLPEIYSQLQAGDEGEVILEVVNHLSAHVLRSVALTSTSGLSRSSPVADMGKPLQVPVGERLLGRVFNVFGQTIDEKEPITGGEWRSIHQSPPAIAQHSTSSEILETGWHQSD